MFDIKHKISNRQYSQRGQSLIEILIALALGVVLIGGSVTLMGVSLRGYRSFKNHLQAIISTRQAMEITQAIIRANWHSISDLTPGIHYKIAKRGNSYTFQKGEEKVFDDTNLVSYWNMDEGSGQIAYDNKNTNNGILMSSPTWKSGSDCVSSSCLEFNGSNYIDMGNVTQFNFGNDVFSLSAWFNPSLTDAYKTIAGKGGFWANNEFQMYILNGNLYFYVDKDGSKYFTPAYSIIANNWYHAVGIYDGSYIKIYVNGEYFGQTAVSNLNIGNATSFRIGSGSADRFVGSIDGVRIYDTALTAEEIREHYKAGLDKLGLVGYWSMDENGETIAYDNANSNNGTLYNSPTWKSSSDCVSGSCLEFNGSNQYVNCGNDESLNCTTVLTIEAWVYNVGSARYEHVASKRSGDANVQYGLIKTNTDTIMFEYGSPTGSWQGKSGNSIPLNQWAHVAVTVNELAYQFYVNGQAAGNGNLANAIPSFPTVPLLIGYYNGTYNERWNGLIDEVRVYNRALTEQEINNRYQAGYTRYITFNKVSRTSGNINTTYSSNNDDTSTLKAISTIKYGEGLVSEQSGGILSVANYFTRSENSKVFHQTDWSGGSGVTGPVSNPSNEYDTSSNITVSTIGQITLTDTESVGELISSIFDTGVSSGAGFNSLLWQGSLGTGGAVKFQIAFSNDEDGPWTYYGPTSTSDWYQPNPDISSSFPTVGTASPQNKRYIRYKINLSTASATPTINDIIINWVP